jgi:hypothetical protein
MGDWDTGQDSCRRANHGTRGRRIVASSLAGALALGWAFPAAAYTAAGDRQFPASIVLPQIGPTDAFYLQGASYPDQADALPSSSVPSNTVYGEFDKTITEDLSIGVSDAYGTLGQIGAQNAYGWQNFQALLRYRAIVNEPHEFLLTVGLVREFGGTGAVGVEAQPWGATTPTLAFGKGLGDLDIGYLRPLAIVGTFGYQFADSAPRPNLMSSGFAIEYSIPYLESEVKTLQLPHFVRALTPMVEFLFVNPVGRSYGAVPLGTIAPGVNYSGNGWEFGVDLLVPTTKATALGLGFTAQLSFSLDFLFPNTLGKPLFGP